MMERYHERDLQIIRLRPYNVVSGVTEDGQYSPHNAHVLVALLVVGRLGDVGVVRTAVGPGGRRVAGV
jgi:hypothetical protein